MEEISTRFKIIELAIRLGDRETIDIQAKKLRDISLDDNLDEIITLLESNNLRQALFLMKNYSNTLKDDFFFDEEDNKEQEKSEKEEKKEYSSFEQSESGIKIITVEDLLKLSDRSKESIADYDDTRNSNIENIDELYKEESKEDDILHIDDGNTYSSEDYTNQTIPEPLYDTPQKDLEDKSNYSIPEPVYDYQPAPTFELDSDEEIDKKSNNINNFEDLNTLREYNSLDNVDEKSENENHQTPESEEKSSTLSEDENQIYPPIPHIELKFKNMLNQYPPLEEREDMAVEIYPMIEKISEEGYSEQDILDFLDIYQRAKKMGDKASAAQILLLAAATESKFAQFLLARELFSGEVLQKDHGEAFTQIKQLAEKNFPEAICDLGQFYEYGIGIDKDKKMALILYEEAAELGVDRAKRHVDRLKKGKGLLKFFKF